MTGDIEDNPLFSSGHSLRISWWDYKAHSWNVHGTTVRVLHIPFGPVVPEQGVACSSCNGALCCTNKQSELCFNMILQHPPYTYKNMNSLNQCEIRTKSSVHVSRSLNKMNRLV